MNTKDLLAALDLVGLESDDGRTFRVVGTPPFGITSRFPVLAAGAIELAREFPFLAPYLDDAESFWREGTEQALRSGPWTQVDACGVECQLQATAVRNPPRRTLLIEVLGADFERWRGILQSAREQSLAMERLEKTQAALREREQQLGNAVRSRDAALTQLEAAHAQLEQRVAERTAELVAANGQLLEYQRQLRALVDRLSVAEEGERRRIAAHLHDRIGQSLALASMKLGTGGSPAAVRELLDASIAATRSLTFDLGAPLLYDLGLESALESLTLRLRDEHSIPVRFVDDGASKPLTDNVRSVLYQAVRELCHNIVKHAQPRRVDIAIRRAGDRVEVVVEDQGVGFDASRLEFRVTKTGGFGLFNIKERLDHLGGRIEVTSRPGVGTRVVMLAPLAGDVGEGARR